MKAKRFALLVVLAGLALISAVGTSAAQDIGPFGPLPPLPPDPPLPPVVFAAPAPYTPFGAVSVFASPADPETNLKQEILRVLIQNEPDRAIDIAADRLKADPADPVVINNLSTIANSKSSKAAPFILSIAKSSTNTNARRSAINSLGRISSLGLSTLEDLYKSANDSVETRVAIVSAIARISEPRTVTVLANIGKNDADVSVRRAAVQALSRHNEPDATKALEELLKTTPSRGRD